MRRIVPGFFVPLLLLLAVLAPAPSEAKDPDRRDSLLSNGSFEQAARTARPKATAHGAWVLPEDGKGPLGWSLNAQYPGTLAIVRGAEGRDGGPDHGAHALAIHAHTGRDAHVFQQVPALKAGTWYRIAARIRGAGKAPAQASLMAYAYPQKGAPATHNVVTRTATVGDWTTLAGFFTPPAEDFARAAIVVRVAAGGSVHVDDVQVHAMDGPTPKPGAKPITLKTRHGTLVLGADGAVNDVTIDGAEKPVGPKHVLPFLRVRIDGVDMPVATLAKRGKGLLARFPDKRVQVRLGVASKDHALTFRVESVKPKQVERVTLGVPVAGRRVRDAWMPGTYDDEAGVALLPLTATTQSRMGSTLGLAVPQVTWHAAQGMNDGACALVLARDRDFLKALPEVGKAAGLPVPYLPSGYGPGTHSRDWARVSPAVKKSYLFATHLGMGDIDKLIDYAKVGGFGLIMIHRKAWRASAGHEAIARTAFPEGLSTLEAVCDRIHAAGLGVGLHLYGPALSLDDAYVTPEPDPRIFAREIGRLAKPLDATATELVLAETPPLRRIGAPDLDPGNLLRVGDEIIRWTRMEPGTPAKLTGCERGALGTKASAHGAKARVNTLAMRNGGLLVDPDSTLPAEMGAHLANVVNTCKVDLVYFDAVGGSRLAGLGPPNWYYLNKVLLEHVKQFDHGVIVQTGQGPGRQLLWHVVPRSASADGHGDLKKYLDQRMAGIRQMRRTHTAADIGWYALDIHGRPDELEYVCAKALAYDASVSVEAHKPLLESHPRAREVFETIGAWERRRLAGDVPSKLRELIQEPGRDVHLVETAEDGAWSLWEARYGVAQPIARLDGKANAFVVTNPRKKPVSMHVEVERIGIAATPQDHVAKGMLRVAPLSSAAPFKTKDDAGLAPLILFGGRRNMADGFARRGTTMTVKDVADDAVGGKAVEISLASRIGGAGWGGAGRTLDTPLDLSTMRSLGLYVHGDGRGASLVVTLGDAAGRRARFATTLDYTGWRFQSFTKRGTKDFDWSQVKYVMLELAHAPPRATITARVAALHAMPTLHAPAPMPTLKITVGRRTVFLSAALKPGQALTIDAIGQGMWWQGGMQPGVPHRIDGGPFVLEPGETTVEISAGDPAAYGGDLRVRLTPTWPLGL